MNLVDKRKSIYIAEFMAEGNPNDYEYRKGFAIGQYVSTWDAQEQFNIQRQNMIKEYVNSCFPDVLRRLQQDQEEYNKAFDMLVMGKKKDETVSQRCMDIYARLKRQLKKSGDEMFKR